MKHARYYFLFFILYSLFWVHPIHAQAPSPQACTFRTVIKIYKDNRDSENNIATTADFDKKLTVVNDKGQPPLEVKTGTSYMYDLNIPNLKIGKENGGVYEVNAPASVKLLGLINSGWHVKSQFCDQNSPTASGCPLSSLVNIKPSKKIQGFRVNCGVDITYGWVIEKDAEKPKDNSPAPTTPPAHEPTLNPSSPLQCSRVCIYTEQDGLCHKGACPADAPGCGFGINNGCKYAGAGLCGINANGFKCDSIKPPDVTPAVITENDELAIFVENTSDRFKEAKVNISTCDSEGGGKCQRTIKFTGKGTQKLSVKSSSALVRVFISSVSESTGGIRAQAQKLTNAISLVTDCNGDKGQVNDAGSENETCNTNPPAVVRFKILDRNAPTPTPAPPIPVKNSPSKPGCELNPAGSSCTEETLAPYFGDQGSAVVKQFAHICWRESRGDVKTLNDRCKYALPKCGGSLKFSTWPPVCITEEYSVGVFQNNIINNCPGGIANNYKNKSNSTQDTQVGCFLTEPQVTNCRTPLQDFDFNVKLAREKYNQDKAEGGDGFGPWGGKIAACN